MLPGASPRCTASGLPPRSPPRARSSDGCFAAVPSCHTEARPWSRPTPWMLASRPATGPSPGDGCSPSPP
eukprot:7113298-Alexandrium_andersonii.AAC.1